MMWNSITIPRTSETVFAGEHPSGLKIYVYPKAGYSSTYATIGTRYGSIDTTFAVDGKQIEVPAGIAHYLEHKLFENEDCDAFEKYAQTGANANAYTGFGQTAYIFSCTEQVEASLEILLDFVQNPFFTEQNVEKERGIIAQEIRMCEDDPERGCMFNLLQNMYSTHPVRIDIAGTVDSIAQITPELLYDCYHTFYNLHNMVLVVSGNITTGQVQKVADRVLKPALNFSLQRQTVSESDGVTARRVEAKMPVAVPLFYIGFKKRVPAGYLHTPTELAAAEAALEMLAGRGSRLYTQLMDEGLINETFGSGFFEGSGYAAFLFSGETRDPERVVVLLQEELEKVAAQGIDPERFSEEKNAFYGRLIQGLNDVENCGDWLMDDYFYGREPFALIDSVASLDVQSVEKVLRDDISLERMVLSVVWPEKED